MNEQTLEHDFFIRRWQVRLVIAGLVLPPLLFVALTFGLGREEDGSAICGAIVAGPLLLTALILQGMRLPKRIVSKRAKQVSGNAEQVGDGDTLQRPC
ncbi:hypothetical protein [Haloferula sp.]|uniref:hypothetical protein n=1 Tax=Haloferula sp. TaxID=2497595 RepID=UPI0032A04F87